MSSVNEWITREYFETLGFLIRQPQKYQVMSRSKLAAEEVDLVVYQPSVMAPRMPEKMLWGAEELRHVGQAVVGVRGWHTERFSAAVLEMAPELFRFTDATLVGKLAPQPQAGPVARILCLSELPASRPMQNAALDFLRAKGVDGVILFRTMLLELAGRLDVQKNYEKSDLLQILRILKNYDLLKDAQLDLFKKKRRPAAPGHRAGE